VLKGKRKEEKQRMRYVMSNRRLTARGHHQGEEHRSLGLQIQAASLISQGPPTRLQGQTFEQVHFAAHGSC